MLPLIIGLFIFFMDDVSPLFRQSLMMKVPEVKVDSPHGAHMSFRLKWLRPWTLLRISHGNALKMICPYSNSYIYIHLQIYTTCCLSKVLSCVVLVSWSGCTQKPGSHHLLSIGLWWKLNTLPFVSVIVHPNISQSSSDPPWLDPKGI